MKSYEEMSRDVFIRINSYNERKKEKRIKLTRTLTSVSCICLVTLLGFGIWGSGVLNRTNPNLAVIDGTGVPTNESSKNTDKSDSHGVLPPSVEPIKIIYGNQTKDEFGVEEENLFSFGRGLHILGNLKSAMEQEHETEDRFAVGIRIDRAYERSSTVRALYDEGYALIDAQKDAWMTHEAEAHGGLSDNECEECKEFYLKYEQARLEAEELYRRATELEQQERPIYAEETMKLARDYMASIGYDFKEIKVVFSDESAGELDKEINTYIVFVLRLTEEEIRTLKSHEESNVGIMIELIPEWMETDDPVIYCNALLTE